MKPVMKTILLSGALVALTAHAASAQPILARVQCQAQGGKFVDGKCEVPTPPPAAGPRAGGQQGQPGQQGQNGRPGAAQGGQQQQPAPQQAQQQGGRDNNGRDTSRDNNGRDNNDRNNNNFGQNNNNRDNNYRDNDNRGNNQFGNNRNNGRNYDQAEFNRRYYGRYGSDPNNFARDRQRYRAQQQWRERYPHDYVYADDSFYRDCRNNNEVGGAIIGAILGGILGNSVSNGQGGATVAGMILGGVGGASIASNLDCEDRTYVYRTYYDGFERGRRQTSYPWRNDRTGHYGSLMVGDYYQDRDNYRCATYSQTIYVRGTPQIARGHACKQQDGTWAIVD